MGPIRSTPGALKLVGVSAQIASNAAWSSFNSSGWKVTEGLPGEREAAYRADADKPRQIA
jgi:hypothetical protein